MKKEDKMYYFGAGAVAGAFLSWVVANLVMTI